MAAVAPPPQPFNPAKYDEDSRGLLQIIENLQGSVKQPPGRLDAIKRAPNTLLRRVKALGESINANNQMINNYKAAVDATKPLLIAKITEINKLLNTLIVLLPTLSNSQDVDNIIAQVNALETAITFAETNLDNLNKIVPGSQIQQQDIDELAAVQAQLATIDANLQQVNQLIQGFQQNPPAGPRGGRKSKRRHHKKKKTQKQKGGYNYKKKYTKMAKTKSKSSSSSWRSSK
jgi:DNA repair exonuclease SbcCD ATPase subunit